eukprot:symbB.v1.2.012143.t1/scaffold829.1/size159244/13
MMLNALTWRDVQNAYMTLLTEPEQLFVSVSTAGPGSSFVSGGQGLRTNHASMILWMGFGLEVQHLQQSPPSVH